MKHLFLPMVMAALWAGQARAGESDTRLPRLPLHYVSAFAGMSTHADAARVEWSLSNALVGALQGHAGHWRRPPAAAPSTPPSSAPTAEPPRDGARP